MAKLAPVPSVPRGSAAPPIIVAGFLTSASGLGQSARLCLEALRDAGLEAYGLDLSGDLMQGRLAVDYKFAAAAQTRGPGTVVLHVNPPLVPLALFHLGRDFVAGKRIVGYWAWELPQLPDDWPTDFRYVHEVWVPSSFAAAAVRARTGLPVRVMPHPVPRRAAADMSRYRAPGVELLVLTAFNFHSGFTRKNPLAAIAAFVAAFGSDPRVGLVVKSMGAAERRAEWLQLRSAAEGAGNITLVDQVMSESEVSGLIQAADVVLSLHRAEGFGLVIAEAMLRGTPVVATNWSGNVDFLNERNGCPVGYRLVPATDPRGTYDHPDQLWADPDIESAAAALRRLRDPALRESIGASAAADAARLFAPSHYTDRVRDSLACHRNEEAVVAARAELS